MARHKAKEKAAPKTKPRGEHYVQKTFFDALVDIPHPAARLCFAVPNGAVGKNRARLLYFLAEGLKGGVPDTFTAWPTRQHHGLFIEFKYGSNTLSENQQRWFVALKKAGYRCEVAFSAEEAIAIFCQYIGIAMVKMPPTEI